MKIVIKNLSKSFVDRVAIVHNRRFHAREVNPNFDQDAELQALEKDGQSSQEPTRRIYPNTDAGKTALVQDILYEMIKKYGEQKADVEVSK